MNLLAFYQNVKFVVVGGYYDIKGEIKWVKN